jgi:hypothetical protein
MQDHLTDIFQNLKRILKEYEGPFTPKFDMDSKYDLWSFKDLTIAGRKRKEVNFASIIIHSKHVGFYYMPIYTDTDLLEVFDPELLKHLKGKSCFHIKQFDEGVEKQIRKALEVGFELYKKRGWV